MTSTNIFKMFIIFICKNKRMSLFDYIYYASDVYKVLLYALEIRHHRQNFCSYGDYIILSERE